MGNPRQQMHLSPARVAQLVEEAEHLPSRTGDDTYTIGNEPCTQEQYFEAVAAIRRRERAPD